MTDIETALSFHRNGNLEEAEKLYSKLLIEMPENANLLNLFGVLKMQQNKLDESITFLQKAVSITASPLFTDNLGLVYYLKQDYQQAAEYFEMTIEKEFFKDTAEKLVDCHKQLGNRNKALEYLKIIHSKDPNNIDLIRNIAQFADSIDDYSTAIEFYKQSIKLEPNDWVGENNLGLLYEKISNPQHAKNCYLTSLKIKNNFEAHKNLGVLYRREKNYKKSEEHLKKALFLKPQDSETHLSLGMTYLIQKKFKNGYEHYLLKNPNIKNKYKNPWDGTPLDHKSILVFCDGGFGDYIMFSRYLFKLNDIFSKITVLVPPQLEILFTHNFPFADIRTKDANIDYDTSVSIMDLPYFLDINFDNIPFSEGYLKPTGSINKDLFKTTKYKVGIFWHGNQRVFKNRSIPIDRIKPIFNKDIQLYSFQIDDEKNNLPENIIDLSEYIKNFNDTANAMKNLDLMISIDSACAHLAGALSINTYLLLPYDAEWRWFDDEEKTPWYKSIKLFKLQKDENWDEIIEKISKKF